MHPANRCASAAGATSAERKLPGKLKENEKPYEKFISLISALRASAKCTSPFYIEMGRPFYFNGGSVPFAFKLELNYISIR